jgi:MFS family permease
MFFSIGAGRVIDRIGFRAPMLLGTLLDFLGVALIALAPSLVTLHIGAALVGSGFMLYQIAVQNAVGYIGKPEDRAVNFSWLSLSFSTSMLVAPLATGIAIDTFGHRAAFAMLALFPLVPLATFALGRIALPPAPAPVAHDGPRRLSELVRHKRLRYVFLVTALTAMAWDLFTFVMPIYGSSIGLSATRIGAVMGAFAAATFLVRLAMPFIVRRLSPWHVLTGALALTGCAYLAFPFSSTVPVLIALAFALGLGLGCAQPMVMSLLHGNTPAGRVGEALGLRAMMINASQTALPLFFGAVGAAAGILPVFWLLGLVVLGGSATLARQARKAPPA